MVRPAATSLLATATAILLAACFDTSNTLTTGAYPTRLTVDPAGFRGALRCGAPELVSYVVTMNDVSPSDSRGSRTSPPVACENFVSFGGGDESLPESFVVIGHFYTGKIDGYDRDVIADPLAPADAGMRRILDPISGEEVAPKWTTTCGEWAPTPPDPDADIDAAADTDGPPAYNQLRAPTVVVGQAEVILHGCFPLSLANPDASADGGSTGGTDAAADNGSTGGTDASADGETPRDSDVDAADATGPDGGGPEDAGPADTSGPDDGNDDGAADADAGPAEGGRR